MIYLLPVPNRIQVCLVCYMFYYILWKKIVKIFNWRKFFINLRIIVVDIFEFNTMAKNSLFPFVCQSKLFSFLWSLCNWSNLFPGLSFSSHTSSWCSGSWLFRRQWRYGRNGRNIVVVSKSRRQWAYILKNGCELNVFIWVLLKILVVSVVFFRFGMYFIIGTT